MPPKRTLVVLISTGLVAGCAVGPDYQRPEISLSERFLGQAAVEKRPEGSHRNVVDGWAGFADPQLTRFVTLALQPVSYTHLDVYKRQRPYRLDATAQRADDTQAGDDDSCVVLSMHGVAS